jgi:mannose-6-phosphate isomerase-like protein (cupin superfamily)
MDIMVNAMTIDNQENGAQEGMQVATPIARLAVSIRRERERLNLSVTEHVQVIRANEGAATYSEQANYAATLLAACPAGVQRDIYRLKVQPGEARISQPHMPGTIEHVILSSGRARIGPVTQPVELGAGDYISYSADVPHLFDALEADTSAVMLIEHG